MGSYVLYLLMQAFVAMIVAYFAGTRALRGRDPSVLLPTIGLYLLMGSSLVEVWGDRAGWTALAVGCNAALVTIAVASMGSGVLLGSVQGMERPELARRGALLLAAVAVGSGAVLAATGGSSGAVVDPSGILDAELSGGFRHLGAAGWALGAPLFAGAAVLSWMGARAFAVGGRPGGLWLVVTGGLLVVWPLDPWVAGLPLAPAVLIFAVSMAHFGLQTPAEGGDGIEAGEEGTGSKPDGPDGAGAVGSDLAPWVKEAADALDEGPGQGDAPGDREEARGDAAGGDPVDTDGPEREAPGGDQDRPTDNMPNSKLSNKR